MKLSYDAKYNVAYLRLHEKTGQVTTIKVSDEMNIDMAPSLWSRKDAAVKFR